ncbi:COG3650 family protein [Brevundimonas sp.]|uniref:COG3650 family protein n=1 Tax=Brevundimonas sp. TaxID=1871086 RepID=UPI003F6ECCCD
MRPVFAALAVLALGACSPADEPAPPSEAPEPAPVLGGVDLDKPVRALGTEPFWSVELTGTEMVYTAPEPPEQRAPQPDPLVQGTTATWEAETADGTALRVTLIATECSDGMSDRTYPLTAMVKLGERELIGCAASTAAIMSTGESGPVVE